MLANSEPLQQLMDLIEIPVLVQESERSLRGAARTRDDY